MYSFPEFVYSRGMQLILFFVSSAALVVNYYGITNLLTMTYGQEQPRKRKLMFAAIVSLGLNQLWIYGLFALSRLQSFPPVVYSLITAPNPLFALAYYWVGLYVLRLSKYRSVRVMRMFYLYALILRCTNTPISILVRVFADAADGRYNYLLDAISVCIHTVLHLALCILLQWCIVKNKFQIQLLDSLPIKKLGYELTLSFFYASVIYIVSTMVPLYFADRYNMKMESIIMVIIFLVLLMALNMMVQYLRTMRHALSNKEMNLQVLSHAVQDFSGLKHDFFNILQTYEGYISIGDLGNLKRYHKTLLSTTTYAGKKLDLAHQMSQNPELTTLLIRKQQKAADADVQLTIRIQCDIRDFYIPRDDLCRCISLLLSVVLRRKLEQKSVIFSIEQKADATKLIMLNSRDDKTNELDVLMAKSDISFDADAMCEIRRILYKYNNVFFHGSSSGDNFFAYIELHPPQ